VAVGIVSAILLSQAQRGGFEKLNGRWIRPDGGYILEIRAVDPSGKIDVLYLNPRPINIAKAEATRDGIAGSFVGGGLAQLMNLQFEGWLGNLLVAAVGAILLLFVWRAITARSTA
jgi:hypothetical protein